MAGLLGGGGNNNGNNKGLLGGLLGTVDDTTKGLPIVGGITSPLLQTVGGVADGLPIVGSGGLGGQQTAQQTKLNAWGEPIKTGPPTTYQSPPRQAYTAPQASTSSPKPAVKKTVPKKVAAPKAAATGAKALTPEQKKKRLIEIKKQQLALEAAELEDD